MPDPITVIIPTYNRPKILTHTLDRLFGYLKYDGKINFLIGDDSDKANRIEHGFFVEPSIRVLEGPGRGLGANLNMLLREVDTDIVMQMDDDHWLQEQLDINQYCTDLRTLALNVGWIRLFLGEPKDIYMLGTYYKFEARNYGPYWFLSPNSPELYLASNRPHIKNVAMHKSHFGWYPEDKKLGKTEEGFCHQYKTTKRHQNWNETPWVTIPMFGLGINQWKHVGDSWQKRGK